MQTDNIQGLAEQVTDVAALDGGTVTRVEMGEMADGSRRDFALVYTIDAVNELKQEYRVSSPARWDSPEWASVFTDWTVEVRTGGSWLPLEVGSDA